MPKGNVALYAFNRGSVSSLALARIDVDRLRLSAETQINWLPRVIGPMMLRPGLAYAATTRSNLAARILPFIYSNSDIALLEFTDASLRVLISDTPITRPSVSTTVANFSSGGSWTTSTSGGGTASTAGSVLTLNLSSLGGTATATQTVTLGSGASGIEHALRITVTRGPVKFRVGTTSGADDLFATTTLDDGEHSLAFTPSTTFYIQFEGATTTDKIVASITLEAAGVMTLTSPYVAADLAKIRTDQSADVVFIACQGYRQRKIERRSTRSWSVVSYKADDGPFTSSYSDSTITITPSATTGNVTLTASKSLFKSTNVGSLYRLFHSGQSVTAALSAADTYSNPIRVTGVGAARSFTETITGTWSGTLTLQRSFDGPDSGYSDFATYTTNLAATAFADGLSNSIVWYRVGFKAGAYTSGTATVSLAFSGGGDSGVCRLTAYSSGTSASAEVLSTFSNTTATRDWKEGAWSDRRGFPSAVALHEGRLWWAGNDRFWGSVSDAYTSFDIDTEGDSGPIDRTIGQGPIARVNWLTSVTRLLAGADRSIISARSSSFDEPLTPTNFNLKESSTQGAYIMPAVKVDSRALFVQASNRRVYDVMFDVAIADYKTRDLTRLNDEIGVPGFVDIAVQRQPDTMVHLVRADGTVACLLYDVEDQVEAWWEIETDGLVEAVAVLPGTLEDSVYYVVKRTINGSTVRYIEKFARIDQCQGGTLSRCADSHVVYEGSAATAITGLSHLEGETVVVWADGVDVGTHTVASGQITLDTAATSVCVGLAYEATYKSAKLAYAAAGGTALNQPKRVTQLGLVLGPTHYQGLQYGVDEDHLDDLPLIESATATPADTVWDAYDEDQFTINGNHDTDTRLILKAAAPRPVTVMAAVVDIQTNG